jgi:2-succinyl-5-enolpyruvyl-6-hydroxy-3-cyclohexene-1-carboxylate synthase
VTDGSSGANVQADFAATLVDEWARCGVRHAVVCPGSRSAPLALALAEHPAIAVHVRLDERSAGFFALGLALSSGVPAVVCTTSGTAAVELHPAVVEAHHARVPLLACTADRPPELQSVGAPQAIDQHRLYGAATRWFAAPGVPDPTGRPAWRSLAARSFVEATAGPFGPGPVHLNLAFREPLHGPPGVAAPVGIDGGPVHRVESEGATGPLVPEDWWRRRGLIVAGAGCGEPAGILSLAARVGWPVVADPRSGCRVCTSPDGPVVVAGADAMLRVPDVAEALRPDALLMLGAPPASKVWAQFVASSPADVVAVDPWWSWRDPDRVVGTLVTADPTRWVSASLSRVEQVGDAAADEEWARGWARAEAAAQQAIEEATAVPPLTEPAVARTLLPAVPAGTRVVVSSSMPVRDLEWFAPAVECPPRVYANRGANGIDGVCSTALGLAATGDGPVVAVVGDLAFMHDVSALVQMIPTAESPQAAPCTVVVLDNGGGAIFSFLPHASTVAHDRFESLFGTPPATEVAAVARGFGLPVTEVSTVDELEAALAAPGGSPLRVVRVVVPDRTANVEVHDLINTRVATAVRTAFGTT